MFSSFTPSALLTYLQSNHIHSPLIHPSHLVVALCSVCCLNFMMMPNPKRTLWGHAFTRNAWCLGFSLLLLLKKMFAPSLCPFAPFATITLCFVIFFWGTFLHLLWCLLLIVISPTFFSSLCLSCSLLFCYCSCSNGAHNTSIVLHLVMMFNMVICLNSHLLCFVHFIMTLMVHNGFCLCCFSHSFVALTTYCFISGHFCVFNFAFYFKELIMVPFCIFFLM